MDTLRLVLASNNAKKLKELGALLAPAGVELVTQGALGVAEAEEPHHTFIENALAKARHAAAATGLAAIADDSGLCVDALGGAPGVHSAHYAALEPALDADREALRARQDAANNAKLLAALAGHTDRTARTARVRAVLAFADTAGRLGAQTITADGVCEGAITEAARGAGCPVVLLSYGYNHGEPVRAVPADGWFDRIDDLAQPLGLPG